MKSLPNPIKPSELIRLAMCDEKKAHASKDYTVDMREWHEPLGSTCRVCFAGAVMAFSLDVDVNHHVTPKGFDQHTFHCLLALDSFRIGKVHVGLYVMGLSDMRGKGDLPRKLDRDVMPYAVDRRAFLAAMEKLSEDLEAIDL